MTVFCSSVQVADFHLAVAQLSSADRSGLELGMTMTMISRISTNTDVNQTLKGDFLPDELARFRGAFHPEDLSAMQDAYNRASGLLELAPQSPERTDVAAMVLKLARKKIDAKDWTAIIVSNFRMPLAE